MSNTPTTAEVIQTIMESIIFDRRVVVPSLWAVTFERLPGWRSMSKKNEGAPGGYCEIDGEICGEVWRVRCVSPDE
jgi:hypothetical protein